MMQDAIHQNQQMTRQMRDALDASPPSEHNIKRVGSELQSIKEKLESDKSHTLNFMDEITAQQNKLVATTRMLFLVSGVSILGCGITLISLQNM